MNAPQENLRVDRSSPKWKHLLRKARAALASGTEAEIDPKKIRQLKGQPRSTFNEASIDRLADSIEEIGQIQSGIVRVIPKSGIHEYELVDGERRWRAATKKGLKYRAKVIEIDDESLPFVIAAVANFNRENHTPIEVSDAIEKMLNLEIPIEEIAKVFGISVIWATQIHLLQKLHPEVREMLDPSRPKKKILPVTAAIQIARMAKICR